MTTTETTASISRKVEAELDKAVTDRVTWETVTAFWRIDEELPSHILNRLLDRVKLLEARMERQHGWKR